MSKFCIIPLITHNKYIKVEKKSINCTGASNLKKEFSLAEQAQIQLKMSFEKNDVFCVIWCTG